MLPAWDCGVFLFRQWHWAYLLAETRQGSVPSARESKGGTISNNVHNGAAVLGTKSASNNHNNRNNPSSGGSQAYFTAGPRFLPGREKSLPVVPDNGGTSLLVIEPLPSFREVPSSERQSLFLRKLNFCCVLFDFTDPAKSVKEKEIKRQTLVELLEYVISGTGKFTEAVMEECFRMISRNIFRALPSASHENSGSDAFDIEDEEPAMDPAWLHLHLVYDILMRYVVSTETDAKVAKRYIDHSFVLRLMDMFDSEDRRERETLKLIMHRIYGKFMVHRSFIRKAINNIFYRFIFETQKHNGIAELLEILGSIVNGFALPLKEEHKLFLTRLLIPLHKPKCVGMYHLQLSYCVSQFLEKDIKLADTIVRGLLKYWPMTNSQKEVLFLGELEEVLEAIEPAEFQRCMIPLFRQIGRCLNSSHFQVAERALFLWNSDHIVNLVAQNRTIILPLIFTALERNSIGHWNLAINGFTATVRKLFLELDQELFRECQKKYQEDEEKAKGLEEKRERTWKRLEALAASKAPGSEQALVTEA